MGLKVSVWVELVSVEVAVLAWQSLCNPLCADNHTRSAPKRDKDYVLLKTN